MSSITLNRQRLKQCRENLGITKQEAARRMLLSQPAYLRYESGDRTPSIHVMQVMADVLGTSVDYLTDKTDESMPNSYIVKSDADPELFQFIQMYKNSDDKMRQRILAYTNELNKS